MLYSEFYICTCDDFEGLHLFDTLQGFFPKKENHTDNNSTIFYPLKNLFVFHPGQHDCTRTQRLSEDIPVRFIEMSSNRAKHRFSWKKTHISNFQTCWTERWDCVFQAKEADSEGIQAVLVQVPGYLHLLFQEQRGEHWRAHSADQPQRWRTSCCIFHFYYSFLLCHQWCPNDILYYAHFQVQNFILGYY